jgi:hypothetical protein
VVNREPESVAFVLQAIMFTAMAVYV